MLLCCEQTVIKKLKEFKNYKYSLINGIKSIISSNSSISDIFTIEEIKKKPISKLKICWIGDGNNNVINSLIVSIS